jgi:hypothetical protein
MKMNTATMSVARLTNLIIPELRLSDFFFGVDCLALSTRIAVGLNLLMELLQ